MTVATRIAGVRQRIDAAARRSGRDPGEVRLVAVSKYRTVEEIRQAAQIGVTDIGENRVQEAESKRRLLNDAGLNWHLVGRLQSNKAKRAVPLFDLIHSVSSVELARRLDRLAGEREKTQRILVQVQLAEEETKLGFRAPELFEALGRIGQFPNLRLEGLMVLPPYLPDREEVRPYFRQLRELRDAARSRGFGEGSLKELSMGMSHDFEVAIEEGATLVRIGTALFGERPARPPSFLEGATTAREER